MKIYDNGLTRVELVEMYKNGVSTTKIAEEFNITPRGVNYILKSEGVETRGVGQPRKHKVNENFFKVWTNEMAWVLGMLITDGCMSGSNYTISFIQKDTTVLDKIERTMEASCARTESTETKKTPSLMIYSKEIYNDLLKMGIEPNKSLTVDFPKVPKEFLPSFIRGIIDGDGWVQDRGYVMNVTSGSITFSEKLCQVFKSWGLNSDITSQETKSGSTIYRVWVRGKQDIINLHNIIYSDGTDLYIEKKKNRMTVNMEAS